MLTFFVIFSMIGLILMPSVFSKCLSLLYVKEREEGIGSSFSKGLIPDSQLLRFGLRKVHLWELLRLRGWAPVNESL
jgi:hypothetical protein